MARRKAGFFRTLVLGLDKGAAKRMREEAEEAIRRSGKDGGEALEKEMAKGGKAAARALSRSLESEYKLRMARTRREFADGLIDEDEFRRKGAEAAKSFNKGLTSGIKDLDKRGGLDDAALVTLTGRYKNDRTAPGAAAGMGLLGRVGGLVGGYFALSTVTTQLGNAYDAADRFDAAGRKLEGTAKLTGQSLTFLASTAGEAEERFSLAAPMANDFTAEIVKLTEKAGDVGKTSAALQAFLDIGAARGMTAAQTLTAVGQSILGIDEGTDKLFGKNPSVLYKEYADKIGTTAGKLTDQEKAQALLDATLEGGERVRGEYLKYLDSAAGKAEQNAKRIEEASAAAGAALQPLRELGGTLKSGVTEAFAGLAIVLGGVISQIGDVRDELREPIRATIEAVSNPRDFLRNLFSGSGADAPRLDGEPMRRAAEEAWAKRLRGEAVDALGNPIKSPDQERLEREERDQKRRAAAAQAEADRKAREKEAEAAKKARERAAEAERKRLAKLQAERVQKAYNESVLLQAGLGGVREVGPGGSVHGAKDRGYQVTKGHIPQTMAGGVSVAAVDWTAPLTAGGKLIEAEGAWGEFFNTLQFGAQDTAEIITGSFERAFVTLWDNLRAGEDVFASLGEAAKGLGASIVQSMTEGMAQWQMAEGLAKLASGTWPPNPAALAAASMHFAAAGAFRALGSIVGGSGGGGYGAVHQGMGRGSRAADGADRRGAEIHIYVDGVDPRNPRHQELTHAAVQSARERHGTDSRVVYHPRRGR